MAKFVLGFIDGKSGKRRGIRVYDLKTKQVTEVEIPINGDFLNLHVSKGNLTPRHCHISEFPIFIGKALGACLPGAKGANAWALGKYTDGRLILLSTGGLLKTVTNETALGFHNQYKIVGCSVSGGSLVPTHSYIPTAILEATTSSKILFADGVMDKEGARAVLALKYDLGTDSEKVLLDACIIGDLVLVKLLLASEWVDIYVINEDATALRLASENGHKELVEWLLELSYNLKAKDYALKCASAYGHIEVVKLLLEKGADLHTQEDYALCQASAKGHKEVVELLLNKGANVHAQEDYALRMACCRAHIEVVKLLLANGADIHAHNEGALSMALGNLHKNGQEEIVKLLLDNGSNLYVQNELWLARSLFNLDATGHTELVKLLKSKMAASATFVQTKEYFDIMTLEDKDGARAVLALRYDLGTDMTKVLFDACKTGDLELVKLIIAAELVDIHTHNDKALGYASENGHRDTVELLISKGAYIHEYDDCALQLSSENGHTEVVELLLDKGADVHANNDYALRFASKKGHKEVVKLLLDRGANRHVNNDAALRAAREKGHKDIIKLLTKEPTIREKGLINTPVDKDGARAVLALKYELGTNMALVLFEACQTGDLELVKLLVASELIDIHTSNDNALRLASENGHKEVAELLLNLGANLHVQDDYALRYASENGHIEVVKLLLAKGADIHTSSEYALQAAIENGHIEVVKLLLSNGANVHAERELALMNASQKGHKDIVKLILDIGVDIHARNDGALRYASESGHIEVVKLLLDRGADRYANNAAALMVAEVNGHKEIVDLLTKEMYGEQIVQQMIDSVVIPEDPREARIQAAGAIQILSGVPLAGLTICVTGKVDYGTRGDLHAFIESKGGKIASSVTKGVDYLITNTPFSATSKNKAAQANGCHIISEPEFMQMVRTGKRPDDYNNTPKPAAPYVAQVYGTVRGKTFCITGRVAYPGKRAALQTYIRSLGGYNSDKVEYGVDYLITNDPFSGSSKNKEANRIGCKVITEEQFLEMAGKTR